MSDAPRIAVAPEDVRAWIRDAVEEGGGNVVAPADAEALVWAATGGADGATQLRAVVDDNPHLRWVQLPWAGVEQYAEAGVFDTDRRWTCGKGVYARPVAEHALGLALAGLRGLHRYAAARTWGDRHGGISLVGGRATIFGGGGIAQELCKLLVPFGCHITVVRRHPDPLAGADDVIGFDRRYEALKGADVVFLALSLTPETHGVISEIELELMEPHAWLVNVARGEHVVTKDLVIALRGDVIGGAALDVTDPEPLPDGHPLWELPNCLITPHTANTEDTEQQYLSQRIRDNVQRFADGRELLGLVDAELGY